MAWMRSSNGASIGTWRTRLQRHARRPVERLVLAREREQLDVVAAPRQRLGHLDGVHDAAARLHAVREHRDPHATAPPRGRGVGRRDDHAGFAQRRLLAARVLRVVRRCRTRARSPERRAPPAPGRARPRGRDASRGRARRRAGCSRRPASRAACACGPRGRPSGAGGPACTPPRRGRGCVLGRPEPRIVSRLVRERAAGEEPEQRRRPAARVVERRRSARLRGGVRAGLERRVDLERRAGPSQPTNAATTRLPPTSTSPSCSHRVAATAAWRRAAASRSRRRRRASASPGRNMIPPTSADRSRPPTPMICDTPTPAPSSRTAASWAPVPAAATIPTGPGRTTLAKPSPTPPEHRRAALGAHDQQAALGAAALERDLVGHRDMVGEQEDVHARGQRAVGLEHGVLAGHRDQRDVRAGAQQRARRLELDRAALAATGAASSASAASSAPSPPPVDGDHDVGRRRVGTRRRGAAPGSPPCPSRPRRASRRRASARPARPSSAARCPRSGCG